MAWSHVQWSALCFIKDLCFWSLTYHAEFTVWADFCLLSRLGRRAVERGHIKETIHFSRITNFCDSMTAMLGVIWFLTFFWCHVLHGRQVFCCSLWCWLVWLFHRSRGTSANVFKLCRCIMIWVRAVFLPSREGGGSLNTTVMQCYQTRRGFVKVCFCFYFAWSGCQRCFYPLMGDTALLHRQSICISLVQPLRLMTHSNTMCRLVHRCALYGKPLSC